MVTTTENSPFPASPATTSGSFASDASSSGTTGTTGAAVVDNALNADAVNRVAKSAHDVVDRVAERAIPAVERLRSGIVDAREAVKVRADNFSVMQDEWLGQCRSTVREKPLTSVAVGVVAGMILSRLIAR